MVLTFAAIMAFSAFEATFALLGEARFSMTGSVVALLFGSVGVVLVFTQGVLVGPVTSRLGERGAIRLGLGLDVVGFLVIGASSGWTSLIVGLMALAVGQGLVSPSLASAIAGVAPRDRSGAALGLQQAAGGLARVLGPVAGGALFALGVETPYVVAAVLTVLVFPLLPSGSHDPAVVDAA